MEKLLSITVTWGSVALIMAGLLAKSAEVPTFCSEARSCEICVRDLECYWCTKTISCNVYPSNGSTASFEKYCPGSSYQWKSCSKSGDATITIAVSVATFVLVTSGLAILCLFRKYKMRNGFIAFRNRNDDEKLIGGRSISKRLRKKRHKNLQAQRVGSLKDKYGLEKEAIGIHMTNNE